MDNEYVAEGKLSDSGFPSSYNETFPTRIGVVDIFEFDQTGFDFANQWITGLLGKGATSFIIQPTERAARKVAHLFFSARNIEKIKGYKNLGFGYPILIKKDGLSKSGILAAPIFIWDIQIEPDVLKENYWSVALKKMGNVRLNPILENFSSEVSSLIEKFNKRIEKRGVTSTICKEFCKSISTILTYQNIRPNYSIEKFPDIVDLATIPHAGAIIWSGIVTVFPPFKPYTITDDSILSKEYWQESVNDINSKTYQFCYLLADHQQKAVQIAASKNKFLVVEGATGSGKSHTITNLIINNLINGSTSLVVGQSLIELEKIANQLTTEGFGDLVFLFKNLSLDKDNLVKSLTAKVDNIAKNKFLKANDFELTYKRFNKFRNQLEQTTSTFGKNVFDINNWTETVGLYLRSSRSEGKALLNNQLQANDFSFDFLEYEQLKEKIEKSEKLFKDIFSFYHPLNELSDNNFEQKSIKIAKNELRKQLNNFLKKARQIQRNSFQKVDVYRITLEEYYENYFLQLSQQIEKIQDYIDQLQVQFGKEYYKRGMTNLKILKTFSEKSKGALALKAKTLKAYDSLKKDYLKQAFFDFEFLDNSASENIEVLEQHLLAFEKTLQNWYYKNHTFLQESIRNLNSKTISIDIKSGNKIKEIEQDVEILVGELNASKVFSQSIKNNAMTLQLKQLLLDEIIEKINSSLFHLRDFETFFDWRKLRASCNEKENQVIKALIKVQPENWLVAFEAWYFHHLLSQHNQLSGNFDSILNTYLKLYRSLTQKTLKYVEFNWKSSRIKTIGEAKKRRNAGINALLKKSTNNIDFANYIKQQLTRINSFFPVFLMTAEMTQELLTPSIKTKFDSLIIKEGGNLTKEQGGNLLHLAEKVLVFGRGFGANSPANSFWNLALSLSGKHLFLNNQHRNNSIPLLAFNNVAFNQQLRVTLNGKVNPEVLKIYPVGGAYDEDLRINIDECRYMLSLLTEIEGTPQNTYPKVGFVCSTVEQRNLFSSYLLKIKQNQSNGADKIKHLERNGMGVFSFEELAGQEFEILIVSLTYGLIDVEDNVTNEIEFLNTKKGAYQLQLLLNSGTQKVLFCHSLSTQFIRTHQDVTRINGLAILCNYLNFGEEIKKENIDALHQILNQLSSHTLRPRASENSVFLMEVAAYLGAYFEPSRILKNCLVKGKRYPLVIKGKEENQFNYIILADNFFNKVNVFSFVWQHKSHQDLESIGYKIIIIWSKDWWRHPKEEARKLTSKIIQSDLKLSLIK